MVEKLLGRTHGAPYRGYEYDPLRFAGGGGGGGNVVRRMGTQQQREASTWTDARRPVSLPWIRFAEVRGEYRKR